LTERPGQAPKATASDAGAAPPAGCRPCTGDGRARAGILVGGALAVIAALVVEMRYEPPPWARAPTWPLVILALPLGGVMRLAKAVPVALHHRRGA
jgi:uncharacterized protein (DUF983 family)